MIDNLRVNGTVRVESRVFEVCAEIYEGRMIQEINDIIGSFDGYYSR